MERRGVSFSSSASGRSSSSLSILPLPKSSCPPLTGVPHSSCVVAVGDVGSTDDAGTVANDTESTPSPTTGAGDRFL